MKGVIYLSLLVFVFICVHTCLQHQMKDVIFLSLLVFICVYACLQHQMKAVIFLSLLVVICVHTCLQHQMNDVIFFSLLVFVFICVHTCLQHQMKDVIFFSSSILPYIAFCILVNTNVTWCTLISGHRCSYARVFSCHMTHLSTDHPLNITPLKLIFMFQGSCWDKHFTLTGAH